MPRKPNKLVIVSCMYCGSKFKIKPSALERGRGKYCSNSCKGVVGAKEKAKLNISPRADKAQKKRANRLIDKRLKLGLIKKPKKCRDCKKQKKLDGHHEDYYKPGNVVWLCRSCHMKRHVS